MPSLNARKKLITNIDPHYGVIVKDEGGLVTGDASDNGNAKRYSVRTSDRENLEASDEFFCPLCAGGP